MVKVDQESINKSYLDISNLEINLSNLLIPSIKIDLAAKQRNSH